MDTYLLSGTKHINHKLVSRSGAGGSIETTRYGNHNGKMNDANHSDLEYVANSDGDSTVVAASGQTVVYTMIPQKGYRLKSVKVGHKADGILITDATTDVTSAVRSNTVTLLDGTEAYTYEFADIQEDYAIQVEWEPTQLKLEKNVVQNGYQEAASFRFKVKVWDPNAGSEPVSYKVKAWETTGDPPEKHYVDFSAITSATGKPYAPVAGEEGAYVITLTAGDTYNVAVDLGPDYVESSDGTAPKGYSVTPLYGYKITDTRLPFAPPGYTKTTDPSSGKTVYEKEVTLNYTPGGASPSVELGKPFIPEGWAYEITEVLPASADPYRWEQVSSTNPSDGSFNGNYDGSKKAVFTNRRVKALVNLSVSKTVTGNMGSKVRKFPFTVSLTGPNGPITDLTGVTVKINGTAVTSANWSGGSGGIYSCTLSHNDTLTLTGLPAGTSYVVSESNGGGYQVTTGITGADTRNGGETSTTPVATVSGSTADSVGVEDTSLIDDAAITFTNHLETTPPTGLYDSIGPALAGLGTAALALAALLPGKRRRRQRK